MRPVFGERHHTQLDLKTEAVRCHERTGRPMGNDEFLSKLELVLDIPSDPGDLVRRGSKKAGVRGNIDQIKYGVPGTVWRWCPRTPGNLEDDILDVVFPLVTCCLASESLTVPDSLMNHLIIAEIATINPTNRTFRIKAWVQVNEQIRHTPEM